LSPKGPLSLFLLAIYTSTYYHCFSSRGRRATSVSRGRILVSGGYLAFARPVRERHVVSTTKIAFSCSLSRKTCGLLIFQEGMPYLLELVPVSVGKCWFPMQRGEKLVHERLLDTCRPMHVPGCEPTILKVE